jgi:transposase
VPRPCPQEFRDGVAGVARRRGEGVTVEQVAEGFGVSESYLANWMTQADRDAGITGAWTTPSRPEPPKAWTSPAASCTPTG